MLEFYTIGPLLKKVCYVKIKSHEWMTMTYFITWIYHNCYVITTNRTNFMISGIQEIQFLFHIISKSVNTAMKILFELLPWITRLHLTLSTTSSSDTSTICMSSLTVTINLIFSLSLFLPLGGNEKDFPFFQDRAEILVHRLSFFGGCWRTFPAWWQHSPSLPRPWFLTSFRYSIFHVPLSFFRIIDRWLYAKHAFFLNCNLSHNFHICRA